MDNVNLIFAFYWFRRTYFVEITLIFMSMNEVYANKILINFNVDLYSIQKVLWLSNVEDILGNFIRLIFTASKVNLHWDKHKDVDIGFDDQDQKKSIISD